MSGTPIETVDLEKKIEQGKKRLRPSGIITYRRTYNKRNRPNINKGQRSNQQGGFNRNRRPFIERRRSNQQQEDRGQQRPQNFDLRPNVIIKGLGSFITDAKLRELCSTYGAMDMCKLDRDSFGNVKPQGIGLVKYERFEDARKMVQELDGVKIVENDENQQSGGQISVKLVQRQGGLRVQRGGNNNGNFNRFNDNGIRRRAPFKNQNFNRRPNQNKFRNFNNRPFRGNNNRQRGGDRRY